MTCPICRRPLADHRDGLLCCPWCAGECAMDADEFSGVRKWYAECQKCVATGRHYWNKDDAVAAWNRRPVDPLLVEARDALFRFLNEFDDADTHCECHMGNDDGTVMEPGACDYCTGRAILAKLGAATGEGTR